MKEVYTQETLAHVTLPQATWSLITDGELTDAFDPDHYPDELKQPMKDVQDHTADLNIFQRKLMRSHLRHAIEGPHAARVVFHRMKTCYEISGPALELIDDTITHFEPEDSETVVHDSIGPARVIFILPE